MNLSQFIGPQGQAGYLGLNAVKRALDSGLSLTDIQNFAKEQGLVFGPKAQDYFTEVQS